MPKVLLAFLSLSVVSCVSNSSSVTPKRPELSDSKPLHPSPAAVPEEAVQPAAQAEVLPKLNNCQTLPGGITLPYYISSLAVVLIGFQKGCETKDGRPGFLPGSSWTAMGFPCTAGHGRIDKKGSDSVPSVVSFHLQNSCPMQPSRQDEVEQQVRQKLHLPVDSHLIAYYPLAVDYWEFAEFSERDVGLKPELFAPESISTGWLKFSTKNEPLKVRLYGRENAWERGKHVYEINATMVPEGRSSFRLLVHQVRSLDEAARNTINDRCEALRPKRNCAEVFVP